MTIFRENRFWSILGCSSLDIRITLTLDKESCLLIFDSYADSTNAYWTGFFTSRPALKRYIRMLSGYYLVRG